MTERSQGRVNRGPAAVFSLLAAIGLGLGGCATATIEDAVPTAATQDAGRPDAATGELAGDAMQPGDAELPDAVSAIPSGSPASADVAEVDSVAAPAPTGPRGTGNNTGAYPNLNIKPQVANTQITATEKQATLAELEAKRKRQAAEARQGRPGINQAMLKKLAATNADKVLKEIEGE